MSFDPYHKWLGIPAEEQPPHHYRLLGISLFEPDADVVSYAADQRMAHVRSFQAGPHADWSQRLLNEIATARVCLLDPERRAQYDADLRARRAPPTPLADPLPTAVPLVTAVPGALTEPLPPPPALATSPPPDVGTSATPSRQTFAPVGDQPGNVRATASFADHLRRPLALVTALAALTVIVLLGYLAATGRFGGRETAEQPSDEVPFVLVPTQSGTSDASDRRDQDKPANQPSAPNESAAKSTAAGGVAPAGGAVAEGGGQAVGGSRHGTSPSGRPGGQFEAHSGVVARNGGPTATVRSGGEGAGSNPSSDPPLGPSAAGGERSPSAGGTVDGGPRPGTPVAKSSPPADDEVTAARERWEPTVLDELPRRLIERAIEAGDNTADLYALLTLARQRATAAGDVRTAVLAIDELDKRFEIDAFDEKLDLLSQLTAADDEAEDKNIDQMWLAELALALAGEATDRGRRDLAKDCATEALRAARASGNSQLVREATLAIVNLE